MRCIIRSVDPYHYSGFAISVKKLPIEIRAQLKEALKNLIQDPQPKKLKLEKLSGYKKPSIYTIHITSNHSHKMSFEIHGDVAVLRAVGTHKQIDRKP